MQPYRAAQKIKKNKIDLQFDKISIKKKDHNRGLFSIICRSSRISDCRVFVLYFRVFFCMFFNGFVCRQGLHSCVSGYCRFVNVSNDTKHGNDKRNENKEESRTWIHPRHSAENRQKHADGKNGSRKQCGGISSCKEREYKQRELYCLYNTILFLSVFNDLSLVLYM